MKKEKDYKAALIITGNYIYFAQLPDYENFEFLEEIARDTDRDYFMLSDEAKEYGIIDQI